jgi:hypothetical protein
MARKKRSDAGRKRAHEPNGTFTADNPSTPENEAYEVTKGKQVANGPTTGYRDAADGKVERKSFNDGWLPDGWHDSPARCDNCNGYEHPEYVEG